MLDGIISQQVNYGMPNVLDEHVKQFLYDHMTWGEYSEVAGRTVMSYCGG